MTSQLANIGDSIFYLTIDKSNLNKTIQDKQAELERSEIYKELQELKKEESDLSCLIEERKKKVIEGMKTSGIKSIYFLHQKMTLKKSVGSIKIQDEELIPNDYKKEKITVSIDKKKLKETIKSGEVVEGATIEYKDTLLIIPK